MAPTEVSVANRSGSLHHRQGNQTHQQRGCQARGGECREPEPDSVGLGLTVSRQMARAMGGDLVYRAVNNASLFSLTLPAVQGSRVTASSAEPALVGAGA